MFDLKEKLALQPRHFRRDGIGRAFLRCFVLSEAPLLTDTAIKALKSQQKLYKVSDRDGMYVVVQPSGAVVFRYDYRLNGRRETLTLGRYGPVGLSLSRARVLFVEA